ncbi:MAG: sodium-dependent transporter [Treponema sp.]|nr:sodium-dependent transporter [Treponema sp.]
MAREKLGTRLGFIMLSAGCAIGCGNVWKFPWMVGKNGGGAFLLVYFFFLIFLGLPALTMEFALGRAAQKSPVKMYQAIENPGAKWHIHGIVCLIGNICLMAFYTVVTGWMIYYFVSFLTGHSAELNFVSMITNAKVNVTYLFIAVAACFFILTFNLTKGLEKVTKNMMVLLLLLMIILAVKSITLSDAAKGLKFYLIPDFSKINWNVAAAAMNQAFFSLSVGIGSMAIFGSYIGKERSLLGESVNVILLDTAVALMAGLIIFPACFSFNLEVDAGPSLLFNTMSTVFNSMKSGRIWGTLFFLFMFFAAFSTELAVCENIVACVRELTQWSRKKTAAICGTGIFTIALTTALGYSKLHFAPFGEGSAWLDFWDFIVSNNILPLGALIFALFCTNSFGWDWDDFLKEANSGAGLKIKPFMKPVFRYFVPLAVILIYVIGLISFFK